MNLHLWAPYNLMRQASTHMRRVGGGRIVNISSVGGRIAVPHLAPYNASKFALVGLSDAFRSELARDGIKVTTVAPGLMRTGSHVHAQFKGNHGAEYTWFAISASLPLVAVRAERAARLIIEACRRGQSSLMIGLSARAAIAGNALFPNLTGEMMKLINRILPGPAGPQGDDAQSGFAAREKQHVPGFIARLGESNVARHNEA
jgi:short-subunit dehydrogenase